MLTKYIYYTTLLQPQTRKMNMDQSYVHEFFLNLTGFVPEELMTKGQVIFLRCFVLTSLPTTFPRERISNFNASGTSTPVWDTVMLDPAPYKGTLLPSTFTDTIR